MQLLDEVQVLLVVDPVMELEEFMDAYRAFCEKYGFTDQRDFEVLSQIEDTLVLAAVTGPFEYWLQIPAGIGANHSAEQGQLVMHKFQQWPHRVHEAKVLYKQAYHLREHATEMHGMSLQRASQYFWRRAEAVTKAVNGVSEEEASH